MVAPISGGTDHETGAGMFGHVSNRTMDRRPIAGESRPIVRESGAPGPRAHRSGALLVSSLALLLAACGPGAEPVTTPTAAGTAESAQTEPAPSAPSDAGGAEASPSSTAAGPSAPERTPEGRRCSEKAGWALVIAQGDVPCEEATKVMSAYERDAEPAPGRVPGEDLEVDGWACEPILFARMGYEPDTYSSRCEKDGAAIMTIDAATELPSDGPIVTPTGRSTSGYGRKEVQWGFISPSGTWSCAIIDNPTNDPGDGLRPGVECEGHKDIPGTSVLADGGAMIEANGVAMRADSPPEPISAAEKLIDPEKPSSRWSTARSSMRGAPRARSTRSGA
ncbi:hypothetical protein GCM10009793_04930 [Brachybacterium phenoliresistens]